MVKKVNPKHKKTRKTLPMLNQNSAFPNHSTLKTFRTAYRNRQITTVASTGSLSVQNVIRTWRAVISNGTRRASVKKNAQA